MRVVEDAGFFSGEDPALIKQSVAWSNAIHQAVTSSEVDTVLDQATQELAQNGVSELSAAEMIRGATVRVAAHEQAMALAPLATRILRGDDAEIDAVLNDPMTRAFAEPTAGFSTDFARRWYGDDARLFLVTAGLVYEQAQPTAQDLSPGLKHGMITAAGMVSHAAVKWSLGHGIVQCAAEFAGDKPPRAEHFSIASPADRGNWRKRFIVGDLAHGPKSTAEEFLEHNAEAASEHATAFMTDAYHAFAELDTMSDEEMTACLAAHIHLLSALAFMGNLVNAESEYMGRYVETELGSEVSARPSLVAARHGQNGYLLVPNPESSFARAHRGVRYGCPGPDPCEPLGNEVAKSEMLRGTLKSIVARYGENVTKRFDRNFSEIDVIGALMIGVASSLRRRGYIKLDKADVALQLKQRRRATSTGAYVIASESEESGKAVLL